MSSTTSFAALVSILFSDAEIEGDRFTIRVRDVVRFARISRTWTGSTGDVARIDVGVLSAELGPEVYKELGPKRWSDDGELLTYAAENGYFASVEEI